MISNLQDEIKSTTLREEGVKSGDLVWLIGDPTSSTASGTEQSHTRSTVPSPSVPSPSVPPPLIQEKADRSADEGLDHSSMHKRPMKCTNVDEGQPMEVETVFELQEEGLRPTWSHDDYMMHVRLANPEHTGLTCAVHSAFLEAGFRPTWKSEVSKSLACPLKCIISYSQHNLDSHLREILADLSENRQPLGTARWVLSTPSCAC